MCQDEMKSDGVPNFSMANKNGGRKVTIFSVKIIWFVKNKFRSFISNFVKVQNSLFTDKVENKIDFENFNRKLFEKVSKKFIKKII